MSSSARNPVRSRAGFTLVEVMVALMLAVLLGGVVFQLVRGQSRFVAVESGREEVQQNTRGALEILASELRSINPSGLVSAEAHAVTFYLPRAWGLTCSGGTSTLLYAIFPGSLPGEMFTINSASGLMVDTADAPVPPADPAPLWAPVTTARAQVDSVSQHDLTAATSQCAGLREPGPAAAVRGARIRGTNFPTGMAQGSTLYLYHMVRYSVDTDDSGEWWIYRSSGLSGGGTPVMQPLAGPLPSADGLRFAYLSGSAGNALGTPVAAADLGTVQRIRIAVTTRSRSTTGLTQTQSDSMTVLLRNQ